MNAPYTRGGLKGGSVSVLGHQELFPTVPGAGWGYDRREEVFGQAFFVGEHGLRLGGSGDIRLARSSEEILIDSTFSVR
jgi:hypothetical protein